MTTKIENITLPEGTTEIRVVEVKGLDEAHKDQINYEGNIDSVLKFLEKRYIFSVGDSVKSFCSEPNLVYPLDSYISINRNYKSIYLMFNETDPFASGAILGKLIEDDRFSKWGIGSKDRWTHQEFARFCKGNRFLFVDPGEAIKLHKELMDVKIKVTKEFEVSNSNQGDMRRLIAQKVIDNNIPTSFKLCVPLFKGLPKFTFEVEIYLDPDNFSITLNSAQATEIMESLIDSVIDEQIAEIQKICPDIPILEQ